MRFHQLPTGARFRYKEATYRKVSSLQAIAEDDERPRLIPRSAPVDRIDEKGAPAPAPAPLPQSLSGAQVERLLGEFIAACVLATERVEPPLSDQQRGQLGRALDHARAEFLTRLAPPHDIGE